VTAGTGGSAGDGDGPGPAGGGWATSITQLERAISGAAAAGCAGGGGSGTCWPGGELPAGGPFAPVSGVKKQPFSLAGSYIFNFLYIK
jgi:hypothetical protein